MTKKYRPYLTLRELEILHSSLLQTSPHELSLIKYLDSYVTDIRRGTRQENYVPNPPPSPEEKYGLASSPTTYSNPTFDISSLLSRYNSILSRASLTPAELKYIQNYRYTHDLMTGEESSQYEQAVLPMFLKGRTE